jgi:hypothetical protein
MSNIIINPYRFVAAGGGSYDTDAQAMFDARAAVSDEPSTPYKQAISDLVTDLKAVSGLWADIIQLVVLAGATTVAGARIAIKGNNLTNNNFVNADIGLKTGSTGNGTDKYWDSGYTGTVAGTAQNDFHTLQYVSAIGTSTGTALHGNNNWQFLRTLTRNRAANNDIYTATTVGLFGMNRSVSGSYERVINNASPTTVTRTSSAANASPYYIHARSASGSTTPETHSDSGCLIWALGPAVATLGDYATPVADFITALNAI